MKIMRWKKISKHCTLREFFWKGHNKMQFVGFFYCVNDDKEVDLANPQIMKCVICYNKPIYAFDSNTKETKGLITYLKHLVQQL